MSWDPTRSGRTEDGPKGLGEADFPGDRLYDSLYQECAPGSGPGSFARSQVSLQSLEAGNDPLSFYRQMPSNADRSSGPQPQLQFRDAGEPPAEGEPHSERRSVGGRSLENLSLLEPFPSVGSGNSGSGSGSGSRTRASGGGSGLESPKRATGGGSQQTALGRSGSNSKPSTSVSGIFSTIASTVTQNISSQIQNALRETTSNMMSSNGMNQKSPDSSKWGEVLAKIHQARSCSQSQGQLSETGELCSESIARSLNLTLVPGEKVVLFSKEGGLSAPGLARPVFVSFVMTNFRIVIAPLFEKNASNKALTVIRRFSMLWMYKSGFLHVPLCAVSQMSVSSFSAASGCEPPPPPGAASEQRSSAAGPPTQSLQAPGAQGPGGGPRGGPFVLNLATKDLRTLSVLLVRSEQERREIQGCIQGVLSEALPANSFCFAFKKSLENDGSPSSPHPLLQGLFEFDLVREYARQGVRAEPGEGGPGLRGLSSPPLRISSANQNFELCPSYPRMIVVPANISDAQLLKVSAFRSKGRIPILSWTAPGTKSTLWRSSQPKSAFKRCVEDEILISTLSSFYKSSQDEGDEHPFSILDARPKLNAFANKATGAGFENIGHYPNCRLDFLNIENIHKVRDSWNKMVSVVQKAVPPQESPFLGRQIAETASLLGKDCSGPAEAQPVLASLERVGCAENLVGLRLLSEIDSTGWYDLVSMILASSNKIVDNLVRGKGVLVHCSDGWDRTSQLTALAMLCVDPYYRTVEGFLALIEKEFVLSGHKFHSRTGTPGAGGCSENDSERSPIFIQWLDCVYQCFLQFPTEFQFHPNLLIVIADHLNNCLFGNFLCDSECERSLIDSRNYTVSLWDAIILQTKLTSETDPGEGNLSFLALNSSFSLHKELLNPLYCPSRLGVESHADVLIVDASSLGISPWMQFWFRFSPLGSKTASGYTLLHPPR
ncbi:myotubularin family protein [Cryptosporidium felis]|nr:myotubularin family protein [Cryptosporidium felis]